MNLELKEDQKQEIISFISDNFSRVAFLVHLNMEAITAGALVFLGRPDFGYSAVDMEQRRLRGLNVAWGTKTWTEEILRRIFETGPRRS